MGETIINKITLMGPFLWNTVMPSDLLHRVNKEKVSKKGNPDLTHSETLSRLNSLLKLEAVSLKVMS